MQLTLIIRKSGRSVADPIKTTKSFRHKDIELKDIIFIDKLSDIDYGMIKSDWWIVLYDDEHIEPRLLDAVVAASDWGKFDVFSFYKMDADARVFICPRMFRKGIKTDTERLYPSTVVPMECLLDGWVLDHDCHACEPETTEDVPVQTG